MRAPARVRSPHAVEGSVESSPVSTSDVIALVSALIAIGALLVSWQSARAQKRKDASDEARAKRDRQGAIQTELADRINAIQAQMTSPGAQPASGRPTDMIASGFAAVATLRALVPRTDAL